MPSTARPTQRSFNAGVLTSWMGGRADVEKFKSGLKHCSNFLLTPFGPIRRRFGFQFVAVTKFSGVRECRVIGFQASTEEGYAIELGHLYMRFHRDGLPVMDGGIPYEIETPWTEEQLFDVHWESVNDVTFLVHPDVPVQILRYFSETDWEIETMEFDFPPMMSENTTTTTLEITSYTDVPIVTTIDFDVPTEGANITSAVLQCSGPYEVVVNGLTLGALPDPEFRLEKSTDGGTTWTTLLVITAVGNYSGTFAGSLRLVANAYEVDSTLTAEVNSSQISPGDTITVQASSSVFTPAMVGGFFAMTHTRPLSEIRIGLGGVVTSQSIPVIGKWTVTTTGVWEGTLTVERSRNDGASWEKVISRSSNEDRNISYTGEEKTPVLLRMRFAGDGDDVRVATLEVENTEQEGVFQITGYNSATSVDGVVLLPFVSQDATAYWKEGAWSGAAGYPRTVQWHANRMAFGGSRNDPGKLWFSGIEDYYNFQEGTNDDSPFSKALGGTQQEIIQWLASKGVLAIGTSGGEWIGVNGDDQNIVTPTGFGLSLQSGNGGARQMAVVANNTILFVQHTGRKVREFSYSVTDNSFGGVDMTQLCIDVTDGGIKDCCLQRQRDTTFWATTNKGKLASMIYERSQSVIGWTVHDTQGDFESVGSVFESGEEDSIYVSVKRNVQGNDVRYIERMVPGQFESIDAGVLSEMAFVDSFRTFDGTATSPGFTDRSDFLIKLNAVPISSNATLVNGYQAIKAAADQIVWDDSPTTTKAIIILTDTPSTVSTPDQTAVLSSLISNDIVLSQGPDFSAFATNNYTSMVTTTGGTTFIESQLNTELAIYNAITGLFPTGNDRLEICFILDKLATPADTINFQTILTVLKSKMGDIDTHLQTKFESIGYSLVSVNALSYEFETVASPTMESIVDGLDHLIGKSVQILADGVALPEQVVSLAGTVTLPEAAAIVHVGLGYTSVLETLPVTIQLDNGDSTGNMKNISEVNLRVYRSVSAETAPVYNFAGTWEPLSFTNRNPVDFDPEVPLGEIGYLEDWKFAGHPGNAKDPRIAIRQPGPFPLNILEVQTTIQIAQ